MTTVMQAYADADGVWGEGAGTIRRHGEVGEGAGEAGLQRN